MISSPSHCPLCPWQPSRDLPQMTAFQHHLLSDHPMAHPSSLPPTFCAETKLYICEHCDKLNIYQTNACLTSHIKSQHSRNITNSQIVNSTLRSLSNTDQAQWLQSLQWLNQYNPTPPPFRAPVWKSLKHNTKR
jgi:hypothetical protein